MWCSTMSTVGTRATVQTHSDPATHGSSARKVIRGGCDPSHTPRRKSCSPLTVHSAVALFGSHLIYAVMLSGTHSHFALSDSLSPFGWHRHAFIQSKHHLRIGYRCAIMQLGKGPERKRHARGRSNVAYISPATHSICVLLSMS